MIELADIAARRDRGRNHRAHVRITLRLIGLEQGFWCNALLHELHLPRQVRDITQPMTHSLAEERRRLVRGITGKEHAASLPMLGNEAVKSVSRRAHQAVRCSLEPGAHEFRDRLGLHHRDIVLAWQQHEFPATMISTTGHDGCWPLRIAHHH